ncbi:hypothetical protein P3W85_24710 [Cupriavidus basilensis]|uniref:DUF1508 domain-containing protein n=1 Tax=Cupriavidus basilensis TaxID=68895 RepID=A0ABT6AUQ5_9BURK|nr:hypothetical protein [Cupriavidus basilensis]MDF3836128.1 hypothetical protein [Cupriavidus basilensis]
MAESYFYKGHYVNIELTQRTFGHWNWVYTLDKHGSFENQGSPFGSRALAMADALENARARIERLSD